MVSREMHENGGFHYHAVAKNESASKKTAARNIREIFPEFEGAQCNVRFPKGRRGSSIFLSLSEDAL